MEAFSLLKYWRGGGGGLVTETAAPKLRSAAESGETTTIVTSVAHHSTETDCGADGDDDGPFFDLEFAVPVEDVEADCNGDASEDEDEEEEEEEGERNGGCGGDSDGMDGVDEFKFTLSSGSSSTDRADPNLVLSPSDDLFFKGRLVAVEPTSSTGADSSISKRPTPATAQFPASFLKSATKFRVFMLGLKKSKASQAKTEKSEANNRSGDGDKQAHPPQQKNLFTVKFKVEEVPIVSLFTRDNSSRNSSSSSSKKQNGEEPVVTDEKRFVMMQKYLKKVKPLYVRVSRRYGEKLRFSGQLSFGSAPSAAKLPAEKDKTETAQNPEPAPTKSQKLGNMNINIPAGLKVVRKQLGKSRSASTTTPSAAVAAVAPQVASKRRDDSLLQQQDGIQGAILHCKRSFNTSRDPETSILARSVSDPSYENSINPSRKSSEESEKESVLMD